MRKSNLRSGEPMFSMKVEHYITLSVFTKALSDHFFRKDMPFNDNLSKTESRKILNKNLFFHGIDGQFDTTLWEGSFDLGEIWNGIYQKAENWVKKNYPYLINKNDG